MSALRYSQEHEWVRIEGDTATIGISNHAQEQLGDIVFIELPDLGQAVSKGDQTAVVESVKAASEIYAPLDGEIVAINTTLTDEPGKVNADPEGDGWFFRLKLSDAGQIDALMSADAYATFVVESN